MIDGRGVTTAEPSKTRHLVGAGMRAAAWPFSFVARAVLALMQIALFVAAVGSLLGGNYGWAICFGIGVGVCVVTREWLLMNL